MRLKGRGLWQEESRPRAPLIGNRQLAGWEGFTRGSTRVNAWWDEMVESQGAKILENNDDDVYTARQKAHDGVPPCQHLHLGQSAFLYPAKSISSSAVQGPSRLTSRVAEVPLC